MSLDRRLRRLEEAFGGGELQPGIVTIPPPGRGSPTCTWSDGVTRACSADDVEELRARGAQVIVGIDPDLVLGRRKAEADHE